MLSTTEHPSPTDPEASQNGSERPPQSPVVNKKPDKAETNGAKKSHKPHAYRDALALQQVAMDSAKDGDAKPGDVAKLIMAWNTLERLKRDMRMKPNPSRVKPPVKPAKRNAAQATFEE